MKSIKIKKVVQHLMTAIFLIALIYFVFHDDYQEIIKSMSHVSIFGLFILLGMSIGYLLLDAASYYVMVASQFPNFSFKQAIELTLLGIFANISTSTAGTIPLQSYYLYQHGIQVGTGISTMILESAFHKISVFIYSFLVFVIHNQWLKETIPELMKYIYLGFIVCALIIIGMLLLCTWKRIQQLLLKFIQMLPNSDKWNRRKHIWTSQLEALYDVSKKILRNRMCCINVTILNLLKLGWNFSIPYIAMMMLGVTDLSYRKTQILASLMFLLIGVLPNVAGVGPSELSFIMLFTPFIGRINASSALVLYRMADYFFPFVISVAMFLKVKKDMTKEIKEKEE